MPSLDLALFLVMIGGSTDMLHSVVFEPFSPLTRDVAEAVVRSQSRLVLNVNLTTT